MTIKWHYKSIIILLQQILWTCCKFLSSINNTIFSVLFLATWLIFVLIIQILFSFIPWIILEWYVESFSSNVYWELFFHWAENYFSWYAILQCFGALAVEVDWFETLTSLGDHFENFANGGVLPKRMPSRNSIRERNKSGFHLSYKICQEPVVCTFVMRFSVPKI